jgi:enamine deaminase RidA (YjgF/YER057c/UK114 family)
VALSPGPVLVGAIIGEGAVRNKGKTSAGCAPAQRIDADNRHRRLRTAASIVTVAFSALGKQKGTAMSAEINIYNPEALGPPMGQYTHVTRVKANEFLFIAGMLSGDAAGNVIGEGQFDVQTAQVFRNIEAALKSAGASWANVVQFTTYLVHSQDIPKFMAFRLREFPKMFPDGKYPPNTLLMVDRLVKEAFLVEVQTIAAI